MATKHACTCTPQCMGTKLIVLGVLIILNSAYGWFDWAVFIGGIIAIFGLVHVLLPVCPCSKK